MRAWTEGGNPGETEREGAVAIWPRRLAPGARQQEILGLNSFHLAFGPHLGHDMYQQK